MCLGITYLWAMGIGGKFLEMTSFRHILILGGRATKNWRTNSTGNDFSKKLIFVQAEITSKKKGIGMTLAAFEACFAHNDVGRHM